MAYTTPAQQATDAAKRAEEARRAAELLRKVRLANEQSRNDPRRG